MNSYRNPRASLVDEPPRYNHSPFVHVYLSYAWNLSAVGAFVDVPFDVAVSNENGCFSFGASPRFTPSVAGRYVFLVNMGLTFSGGASGFSALRIKRFNSGNFYVGGIRPCGTGGTQPAFANLAGSAVVEANLGDYFVLDVYSQANANFAGSNSGEWDNYQIYRLT